MKKLLFPLMSFFLVFAVNVESADAVPDIRGKYSGSYSTVVSNCTDSESNGTYNAILAMSISTQTGNTFSGSATGTFNYYGITAIEYTQLSGTITESGQISGNTSHAFLGTAGEGTFTGQLSGNTLSLVNPGHDTYGETCSYIRTMSATREGGLTPSASFSASPRNGNVPLSVNFTDQSMGTITSWNWSFGDGASSVIQSPSHTYTDPGTYTVSLTVSGPGGSDTETKTGYISVAGIPNINEFKLLPSDGTYADQFGASVSISGDYTIVGAYNDDDRGSKSGSAYIFERNGSSWNQMAKLTASDATAGDFFGASVSISGGYAIVGAFFHDHNGSGSGSAYVFEKSGSNWSQVAELTPSDGARDDRFGRNVSISGGYAIVGAYKDDDKGTDSGSAYIFQKNGSSWDQVDKLHADDGAAWAYFGASVSISGYYAIVGAPYDGDRGSESGSAYIFETSGSSWEQVAKLTASDGAYDDTFGMNVSISGGYAIVGAYKDDHNGSGSGSAYVFERSGSSWNQVAKLTASDGDANASFGWSVSVSGDFAIVGADCRDGIEPCFGSAYVFERSGSSWEQVAKLTASDGDASDQFGRSVSISGGYAIVGARMDDGYVGSAYIYNLFLDPEPDIKANGSNGPLSVSPGAAVSVTVSLKPGSYDAQNADWWVVESTPSGTLNYFDLSTGSMVQGLSPTYQGPLFNLSTTQLLNSSDLAVGTHTFYFGVDLNMNGSLNTDSLYYDWVSVVVQ